MNKRRMLGVVGLVAVIGMAGCTENSNTKVARTVESQQKIYTDMQPIPVYDYSAPRDAIIQLYNATVPEMRPSWHVFMTPGIGATDMCAGVGIPLPYSVQLTSPMDSTGDRPQPEPDSLFKPDSTDGTWVLCDYGNGLEPVYSEDQIRTFFHPVSLDGTKIVHIKQKPSVNITTKERP